MTHHTNKTAGRPRHPLTAATLTLLTLAWGTQHASATQNDAPATDAPARAIAQPTTPPTEPQPPAVSEPGSDSTDQPTTPAEPQPDNKPIIQDQEQAAAEALRQELEQVLSADGRAKTLESIEDQHLAALAEQSEDLAGRVESDQARSVLLDNAARANAALAQVEGEAPAQDRNARLQSVRNQSDRLRTLDLPNANASADYWQLLADLADTTHSGAAIDARQALAEQLLEGFIDHYAQDKPARDYVIDARLALAQLMDDRGDQAGVKKQLEAIGPLPGTSPRREELDRLSASTQRIGQPIQFEAVSTRAQAWRLTDHRGQPVLIHVHADTIDASVKLIDDIKQAIAAKSLGGARVVTLRVGDAVAGTPLTPWPTLPIDLEPGGVVDQLAISALPTLVWIDDQGRIASVGHTRAVLDQMPAAKSQEEQAANPDAQPAPKPPVESDPLPVPVPDDAGENETNR